MGSCVFGLQNLFSLASRERCMVNLKKFRVPMSKIAKLPTSTAAVLVPICRYKDDAALLYTVRSTKLSSHSGQISFPGGKTDKGETPVETALRETEEEIGISSSKIDVWGQGPAFPGRNYKIMITPVIGCISNLNPEDLLINEKEVSEVFAVPLHVLCDAKNQYYTQFKNGAILPVFLAEDYKIWGVTAYITHVFLSCLLPKDVYRNDWMKKKIILSEQ
ncbi:nucleoside diphosphate-linked moiety X motif 8 [Zerene cesonia]|uniref:nucleoside diphosphate-linked moiety X motif 8 n=1 Tax=Zerene cesonia TaxID=33412 RepID=UPI0018E5A401|nr:nucleoside diphosphate-linked moiety X motif 8 [Zerene cesonia]